MDRTLTFYAYDCESARESVMCSLRVRVSGKHYISIRFWGATPTSREWLIGSMTWQCKGDGERWRCWYSG